MKIGLINPPSPFLTNDRVFPNIGLVRVATKLKNEGHEVSLFDFAGKNSNAIKFIAKDFDVYGFSSTSPQMPYTMKLFNNLKRANKKAKTIIGGPHTSSLYNQRDDPNAKELEVFDTIWVGEAENKELSEFLYMNMFKLKWHKSELVRNLDSVPIPDRSFIDMSSYNYNLFDKKTTSIQSQRGCPNKCSFCCGRDVEMYNKVRQHSPERVIKELDELNKNYGIDSFMWYDDEVNVNQSRLEELCNRLSKKPYQHRGFVTSDMIVRYPESVGLLKKAGFVKLCAGVESGSDRILSLIKKRATSEMNYEARRLIREAGIHYEAFTMIGFPTETKKDVNKTIEWIKKAQPDDFDIGILTPYPGSKIYDEAVRSDKFKNYNFEWKGLYFNKPDYSKEESFYKGKNAQSAAFTRTDTMPEKYIHKMRDKIEAMK